MNRVRALTTPDEIKRMRESLRHVHEKYSLLFEIGLETGYRISDLLRIRPYDVLKGHLSLVEKKTGKSKGTVLSASLTAKLRACRALYNLGEDEYYIFSSTRNKKKHLSREQAYRVLKRCSRIAEINGIGTHTMRKTYAVYDFRVNKNLESLRDKMNHNSISTTAMYVIDGIFDKDTV